MSNINDERNDAQARYHARYDNKEYQAFQVALVKALCGSFQASHPNLIDLALKQPDLNQIMNLLTDTCLEACKHPSMDQRSLQLIEALVKASQPQTNQKIGKLVRMISQMLEKFEYENSKFSADFENRAISLLYLQVGEVQKALRHSTVIHSEDNDEAHKLLQEIAAAQERYQQVVLKIQKTE